MSVDRRDKKFTTSSPDRRRNLTKRNIKRQRVKMMPSSPVSPGESAEKMTFSQHEVQTLIQQEVCSTMKKNETMLQGLVETIQQLDRVADYESAIRKLEARMNAVTQQAEAALAYMEKEKSLPPSLINADVRSKSEDKKGEDVSQNQNRTKDMDKSGRLFKIRETTKKALNKMNDDNNALTAASVVLREEIPSTVRSPHSFPKCMNLARTDQVDGQEKENNSEASMYFEQPKAKKVEKSPPSDDTGKKRTSPGQMKPLYPPLPSTPFPSTLTVEAASYNVPQKPEVHLALIRNPPSLSVLWTAADDPFAPPMDSYSVLMSTENAKGSGVFSEWKTVGEVMPISLPMCAMISKYKPGRKVCVAVVGKDEFGRYGSYSEVVTATIPD